MSETEAKPTFSHERYELQSIAGEGGVATVWRAVAREGGEPVAIKVLHASAAVDLEAVQRLAQEVEILTHLRHPCIIRVLGTGVTADEEPRPYVVMEWVDGISLRGRLLETPVLPPADVVDIVNQVCSALSDAHGQAVIHRDVKPENVLLCAPEHLAVKIVDFGMAKLLSAAAPDLTLGDEGPLICGTPEYMSPERARGHKAASPCDVYSVGVMTYEMLTGQRPFSNDAPVRTLIQQTSGKVPPMEGVPPAIEQVVLSALAKNPDNRPAAAEFAHMLEHASS